MSPYYVTGGSRAYVDYNAPWHQDGVFDTAAECTKALEAQITECEDSQERSQAIRQRERQVCSTTRDPDVLQSCKNNEKIDHMQWLKNLENLGCAAENAAVCMASDDPRLAR
jgi:hypothetical protein